MSEILSSYIKEFSLSGLEQQIALETFASEVQTAGDQFRSNLSGQPAVEEGLDGQCGGLKIDDARAKVSIQPYINTVNSAAKKLLEVFKNKNAEEFEWISKHLKDNIYIHCNHLSIRHDLAVDFAGIKDVHIGLSFKNVAFNEISFIGTTFHGSVDFSGSIFRNITAFEECVFKDDANFTKCKFLHAVTFEGSIFEGDACQFRYAEFHDVVNFIFTTFLKTVPDFVGSSKMPYLHFENASLKHLPKADLVPLKRIEKKLLEQDNGDLARQIHRKIIATETYYKYRKMTHNCIFKNQYFFTDFFPDAFYILISYLYLLLNNRGTSIVLPFFWLVLGTVLMGYFYYNGYVVDNPFNDYDSNICANTNTWICDVRASSEAVKSQIFSWQATLWPIKLLSESTPLILTSFFWPKVISVIQSILASVLIYLFIVGIKLKFKIDGSK